MLELLRIHDLALIEDLEMEFAPGMNVLTGETGAGKSFIIKALNFLTGEKIGVAMVRPGKSKAIVEALFILDGEEQVLRRELAAETGRTRLYLNDTLCSQETVQALRPRLLLHTSQHGQQRLLQRAFQAAILDNYLNRPDLLEKKEHLTRALTDCVNRLDDLEQTRLALANKRDVLEYQQAEIEKVAPREGEEEYLEARRTAIRNQAGIVENAGAALAALHGGEEGSGLFRNLSALERAATPLAGLLDDFTEIPARLVEMRLALQEMDNLLRKASGTAGRKIDIEDIEARLYTLAQLKRKLKRPLRDILSLHREIKKNLDVLDSCNLDRKHLEKDQHDLCTSLSALLDELNQARQNVAKSLGSALEAELKHLGFSEYTRVFFEFSPHSFYEGCSNLVELRSRIFWQPNPGQPPQALDKIASGGELSRFLLAVVTLISKTTPEQPILIFDEVDSGVGGLTLNRVADSLERLSAGHQMLLITHWPQLASRAKRHFTIRKEIREGQTYMRCVRLTPADIPEEFRRMAGTEE